MLAGRLRSAASRARGRPGPRGDRGFTLIEVLVSIAIIGVVMTALSTFYVSTVSITNQQGSRQVAVQVAADGLESIRALRGSAIAGGLPPNDVNVRNGVRYTRTYAAVQCSQPSGGGVCGATGTAKFFRVTVTVTWPDKRCPSTTCSYDAATLVSNVGDDPVFGASGGAGAGPTVTLPCGCATLNHPAGTAVSYQLNLSGGTAPITFRPSGSSGLPSWVTVSSNGRVTGTTPDTGQSINGTFYARDSFGLVGSVNFTWTIVAPTPAPVLAAVAHRTSARNKPESRSFGNPGGEAPLTWSAVSVAWGTPDGLPTGVDMDPATGAISGTPTVDAGPRAVTVRVTDRLGRFSERTFNWGVLDVVTPAARTMYSWFSFSYQLDANGGTTPYTFSAPTGAGRLPPGLSINSTTGLISGRPTTDGTYSVVLTVRDANSMTVSTNTFVWRVL